MIVTNKYTDINDWFFSTLKTLLQQQEKVIIALPGGHSLDGWYAASILSDSNGWKGIDISRLRWCLVDERCVDPDSPNRNDNSVWNIFLKPLGFKPAQFLCL